MNKVTLYRNKVTLYMARVEQAGYFFEAIDILPSLARSRLFREIEAWNGGSSTSANRMADAAQIIELRQGSFRRGDVGEEYRKDSA